MNIVITSRDRKIGGSEIQIYDSKGYLRASLVLGAYNGNIHTNPKLDVLKCREPHRFEEYMRELFLKAGLMDKILKKRRHILPLLIGLDKDTDECIEKALKDEDEII